MAKKDKKNCLDLNTDLFGIYRNNFRNAQFVFKSDKKTQLFFQADGSIKCLVTNILINSKKTLLPLYLFWKLVENLQAENTYSNIG